MFSQHVRLELPLTENNEMLTIDFSACWIGPQNRLMKREGNLALISEVPEITELSDIYFSFWTFRFCSSIKVS